MLIEAIPYQQNITLLFSHFAGERHAVLFDSGKPVQEQGRYDIFSAWPESWIAIKTGIITHTDSDKNNHIINNICELKSILSTTSNSDDSTLPFCGGWIGFACYELAYYLEHAVHNPHNNAVLPDFFAAYYSWAIIQDHQKQQAFLVYEPGTNAELLGKIHHYLHIAHTAEPFRLNSAFRQQPDFNGYRQQFERIQHYLDAGDCYQVNLAMHYQANYQGSPFAAYQALREAVPSPQMAYINVGEQQILSISPERFIAAQQQRVQTKPIKGTSPRYSNAAQDRQAAADLAQSHKNRAENLMIVDLLRNDFGRYCNTGSIKVENLFAIESFANVHHLVSTISGELAVENSIWDLFFGSFPGGSITGAPKIRACQIIAELEQTPREIYCGSIFYASNNGHFDSSIAIRTLLCHQGKISAWAGGGIIKDSTAEEEYAESQNKIQRLLKALENPTTTQTQD